MGGDKFHKNIIMRFLEYLFFKYYNFQVRVGNEDIAPFSAILIMCVIFEFVYTDIILFCYRFIPCFSRRSFPPWYGFLVVYMIVFIVMFRFILYKKKYKSILVAHEYEWKKKKNLGIILFTVIPIIVFYIELI